MSAWRAYQQPDQGQVEELSRKTYGEAHDCADEWRHLVYEPDPNAQPQGRCVREAAGVISGYAGIHTDPWMLQVSTRRLDILPLNDLAVGQEALDLLEPLCRDHAILTTQIRVLESMSDAVGSLTERGYRRKEAVWDLLLDVEAAPQPDVDHDALVHGYSISSLTTLIGRRPTIYPELHELWVQVAADQPGYDPASAPPLDKFIAWLQSPARVLGGVLLAHTEDALIGLTMLQPRRGHPGSLTQNITGVVRAWRRRGVAKALKTEGVRYARSVGARTVVTSNSPDNPAILKLNLSTGFVPLAKWLVLEKELAKVQK